MRIAIALAPLLGLFLYPVSADPSLVPGSMASNSGLETAQFALPPGLDLSGVTASRVLVFWDEDEQGKVDHIHFPSTGTARVDAAIRLLIGAKRETVSAVQPSRECAHMFLFPTAAQNAAAGPMIPLTSPVAMPTGAAETPTPVGDRPVPLLADDPTRMIDDISDRDFTGLRPSDVTGKRLGSNGPWARRDL